MSVAMVADTACICEEATCIHRNLRQGVIVSLSLEHVNRAGSWQSLHAMMSAVSAQLSCPVLAAVCV